MNYGSCMKFLPTHLRLINCNSCQLFFHVKCCNISRKEWQSLVNESKIWLCSGCTLEEQQKFQAKCASCRSFIHKNKAEIKCDTCSEYYHSKCAGITIKAFKKLASWNCDHCTQDILPFAKLDNEKLKLTMQGKDIAFGDHITLSPSFTIQSLLDKIPGFSNSSEDDFYLILYHLSTIRQVNSWKTNSKKTVLV